MEFIQDTLRVFVVPVDILDVPDLTTYEKLTYIILRSYANPREATAFPSYATIAKQGSMSRRQAIRCIDSLVEKGLLRKETRLTLTKDRKIRNTSNLYTIEPPPKQSQIKTNKTTPDGDCESPPPVTVSHQGGDSQSPEHNHLTKSFRNMNVCMSADTGASDSILESLSAGLEKINPALLAYFAEIYAMLLKHYSQRLDPEIVSIACRIFAESSDTRYKINAVTVKNPAGYFFECYKDAINEWKAQRYRTQLKNR